LERKGGRKGPKGRGKGKRMERKGVNGRKSGEGGVDLAWPTFNLMYAMPLLQLHDRFGLNAALHRQTDTGPGGLKFQ